MFKANILTLLDIFIDETAHDTPPDFPTALAAYGVTPSQGSQYKWINNFFREDAFVSSSLLGQGMTQVRLN